MSFLPQLLTMIQTFVHHHPKKASDHLANTNSAGRIMLSQYLQKIDDSGTQIKIAVSAFHYHYLLTFTS